MRKHKKSKIVFWSRESEKPIFTIFRKFLGEKSGIRESRVRRRFQESRVSRRFRSGWFQFWLLAARPDAGPAAACQARCPLMGWVRVRLSAATLETEVFDFLIFGPEPDLDWLLCNLHPESRSIKSMAWKASFHSMNIAKHD